MYIKYGRTFHLPWSKGIQSDDKVLKSLESFENKEIVVLEKMDGENTTLYTDHYHARSIDSQYNFTRSWISKMHSVMKFDIPDNFRFVFENIWAEHSIRYENIDTYAFLLSIWKSSSDESKDICLSYDETKDWAELLDVRMPKEFYRGVFDKDKLIDLANSLDTSKTEGYVIRVTSEFSKKNMQKSIAKFVREGHVQPNADHWLKNAKQNSKLTGKIKPYYMA